MVLVQLQNGARIKTERPGLLKYIKSMPAPLFSMAHAGANPREGRGIE
jgi:hypothetical protein